MTEIALPSDQERQLERASAPQRALAEAVAAGHIKMTDILKAIGVKPNDPTHQAALLACERYELDPLLKHIVVIPGAGPYITRDGWLHIAHRSGQFDGMEVLNETDGQMHWTAKVAVHRKDMRVPFTYTGRYPKSGSNKKHGPEMAIKVAEVMALRRAFPVSGVGAFEERWESNVEPTVTGEIETAEILDDPETLKAIDEGLADLAEGDVIDAETLDL